MRSVLVLQLDHIRRIQMDLRAIGTVWLTDSRLSMGRQSIGSQFVRGDSRWGHVDEVLVFKSELSGDGGVVQRCETIPSSIDEPGNAPPVPFDNDCR